MRMHVYTIGFTQKTAELFFGLIGKNDVRLVIDIRLNNISQLAGFAKGRDLEYFLKKLCGCDYVHDLDFAPTQEIMENGRGKKIPWSEYERQYSDLVFGRKVHLGFMEKYGRYESVCLLCSEVDAKDCHRGVLVRILQKEFPEIEVRHL